MKLWERIHPGNRYRFLITDDNDNAHYIIMPNRGIYIVGFDNISEIISVSTNTTPNVTINNKVAVLLEENFSSLEELKSKPELFI